MAASRVYGSAYILTTEEKLQRKEMANNYMSKNRKKNAIISIVSIIIFIEVIVLTFTVVKMKSMKENMDMTVSDEYVQKIYPFTDRTYYIDQDNVLWIWGSLTYGQVEPDMVNIQSLPMKLLEDVESISFGYDHCAALKTDGSLWMWGSDTKGELGAGSIDGSVEPIKVLDHVKYVNLGNLFSSAITADGSLWTWGMNQYGQLGDGTTENKDIPMKIMEDVSFVTGDGPCVALKNDGTLYEWSINKDANFHDGMDGNEVTVKKILENVERVYSGQDFYGAVQTDGSLWMWGSNDMGQLGNGTVFASEEPVKILENVRKVCTDGYTCAAITSDGNLWLWGDNTYGQIGDDSVENCLEPKKILKNVKHIVMKNSTCGAVQKDGNFLMWGNNTPKLVNPASFDVQDVPVYILKGVSEAELSGETVAVRKDGDLWMWGYNSYGQLGDGTTWLRDIPVEVKMDSNEIQNSTETEVQISENENGDDSSEQSEDQSVNSSDSGYIDDDSEYSIAPAHNLTGIWYSDDGGYVFDIGASHDSEVYCVDIEKSERRECSLKYVGSYTIEIAPYHQNEISYTFAIGDKTLTGKDMTLTRVDYEQNSRIFGKWKNDSHTWEFTEEHIVRHTRMDDSPDWGYYYVLNDTQLIYSLDSDPYKIVDYTIENNILTLKRMNPLTKEVDTETEAVQQTISEICQIVEKHYRKLYNSDEYYASEHESKETNDGYLVIVRYTGGNTSNALFTGVMIDSTTGIATDDFGDTWSIYE